MSEELKHKIYLSTDCISEKTMFDYIDNKLSPKEQHQVERHLLSCDLCSDALEGLSMLKDRNRVADINLNIEKKLNPVSEGETKIVSFHYKTAFSIAAAILLLVGSIFLFKMISTDKMKEGNIAELKPIKEVSPPPVTSVPNTIADSSRTPMRDLQPENKLEVSKGNEQQKNPEALQQPIVATKSETSGAASGTAYNYNAVTSDNSVAQNDELTTVTAPNIAVNEKLKAQESNNRAEKTLEDAKKTGETKEQTTTGKVAQTETPPPAYFGYLAEDDKKTEEKKQVEKQDKNADPDQTKTREKEKLAKKNTRDKDVTAAYSSVQNETIVTDQEAKEAKGGTVQPMKNTAGLADSLYAAVDEMPVFPGGSDSLMKFIRKNFVYPSQTDTWKSSMGTKIIVSFVIDQNGKTSDPRIEKGISKELDQRAIDLVNKMPVWKPGKKAGKKVAMRYSLPIQLELK